MSDPKISALNVTLINVTLAHQLRVVFVMFTFCLASGIMHGISRQPPIHVLIKPRPV